MHRETRTCSYCGVHTRFVCTDGHGYEFAAKSEKLRRTNPWHVLKGYNARQLPGLRTAVGLPSSQRPGATAMMATRYIGQAFGLHLCREGRPRQSDD